MFLNYYGSVKKYLENIKQIFIGKSLLKLRRVGGQNPIDAAKMGCHIFHGPYVYNFKEIYDYLNIKKISEEVDKPDILAKKLIQNFKDQTNTSRNNKDSLEEHGKYIFENVINEYEKFFKMKIYKPKFWTKNYHTFLSIILLPISFFYQLLIYLKSLKHEKEDFQYQLYA